MTMKVNIVIILLVVFFCSWAKKLYTTTINVIYYLSIINIITFHKIFHKNNLYRSTIVLYVSLYHNLRKTIENYLKITHFHAVMFILVLIMVLLKHNFNLDKLNIQNHIYILKIWKALQLRKHIRPDILHSTVVCDILNYYKQYMNLYVYVYVYPVAGELNY